MMWNWIGKFIGKTPQPQRKRVQVDIPFEQILSNRPMMDEHKQEEMPESESKGS